MKTLILHIGFPKTGTTTVQTTLEKYSWYIGKYANASALQKDMRYVFRDFFGIQNTNYSEQRNLFKELETKDQMMDNILYSDEDLVLRAPVRDGGGHFIWWPYATKQCKGQFNIDNAPIILGLKKIKEQPNLNIKIILSIRSQWNLIPSLYFQRSDRNLRAGQFDFDCQIERILKDPQYFSFKSWYDSIASIVSGENLLVLPVEIINNNSYWHQLGQFLGAELEGCGAIPKKNSAPREGLHQNVYPIKEIRSGTLTYGVRQLIKFSVKNKTSLTKSFLRDARANAEIVGRIFAGYREKTFMVSDGNRDRLKECYQEENWALSEQIGCDLKSLGY